MDIRATHIAHGATLAPDNIPLHFGDQQAEYQAALTNAILLDRSHEARLTLNGSSALDLLHRISTNDLTSMALNEGRPTLFTNPNARLLDRVTVYQRADSVLLLGEPGRGLPLAGYLQRNIFFGDDVQVEDSAQQTVQFDLHGPTAGAVIAKIAPDAAQLTVMSGCETVIDDHPIYIARRKPVSEQRWTIIASADDAGAIWSAIVAGGAMPAGSLIYNVLRVRAGLPSIGRELSEGFIPLEVGLWDEVSFSKGCYTGQEIIARMESRNRLAKTLVTLQLEKQVDPPAKIYDEDRLVGQLTSCVTAPDDDIFALGVVKPMLADPGQALLVGDDGISATIITLAGVQPLKEN